MSRPRTLWPALTVGVLITVACSAGDPTHRALPTPTAAATATASPAVIPQPDSPSRKPTQQLTASGAPAPVGSASTESSPPAGLTETLDRGTFNRSSVIDNPWFPMKPGHQLILQGKANRDGERVARKIVFTVTDLTKVIDGVRSAVVYEVDYTAGEIEEVELSFFAQDDAGTIWFMGEYPEEYEGGKFNKAPTWLSGFNGAKAGILIQAQPSLGPSFAEGWGPEVGWNDRAKVFELGSKTCVPAGCYDDVLVMDEFNLDEPDAHQLKYYARGVGTVRVSWVGTLEQEQEALQLTTHSQLSPAAIAQVRARSLALEAHGYQVSPNVYGRTEPLQVPAG